MYSNPSLLRSLPPNKVLDYLYCGNLYNAHNKKQLNDLQIEYILNLRTEKNRSSSLIPTYLHCPLDDFGSTNLEEIWSTCFEFIEAAILNKKNILVHCDGGISRAPSIIVGYLVVKQQWSLKTALDHLIQVRPCVAPRENYIRQLSTLEEKTLGKNSLEGVHVETQEVKSEERQNILRKYRESLAACT